jgi:hypothetical protein
MEVTEETHSVSPPLNPKRRKKTARDLHPTFRAHEIRDGSARIEIVKYVFGLAQPAAQRAREERNCRRVC